MLKLVSSFCSDSQNLLTQEDLLHSSTCVLTSTPVIFNRYWICFLGDICHILGEDGSRACSGRSQESYQTSYDAQDNPTAKDYLAQVGSSAEVERPCSSLNINWRVVLTCETQKLLSKLWHWFCVFGRLLFALFFRSCPRGWGWEWSSPGTHTGRYLSVETKNSKADFSRSAFLLSQCVGN